MCGILPFSHTPRVLSGGEGDCDSDCQPSWFTVRIPISLSSTRDDHGPINSARQAANINCLMESFIQYPYYWWMLIVHATFAASKGCCRESSEVSFRR